jgi:hypothetical protein
MLRRTVGFVVATVLMVILGSLSHSLFIQWDWSHAAGLAYSSAPVGIPFADRIAWGAHDLVGLWKQFAGLTAIAFLIAFLIAGGLVRFTGHRTWLFAIAGGASILTLFITLRLVLGTVGVFGARGPAGLAGQALAGLIAGLVFARLTQPRAVPAS